MPAQRDVHRDAQGVYAGVAERLFGLDDQEPASQRATARGARQLGVESLLAKASV